jgi:hypothetical protein
MFDSKVNILYELFTSYKKHPFFRDYVEYNDMGLPLSFLITHKIVDINKEVEKVINSSYETLVLNVLEVSPDKEYAHIETMIGDSPYSKEFA